MDLLLIVVIVVIVFVAAHVYFSAKRDQQFNAGLTNIQSQRGPRRRMRGGGFYPVGYTGTYYDDEILVDEAIWMAETIVVGMPDVEADMEPVDAPYSEEGMSEPEPFVTSEPEVTYESNDSDIFDSGSDDSDFGSDSFGDD